MPTYTVTAPEGLLTNDQKHRIARSITRIHASVTGAPKYFAQVLFNEVKEGNFFVGGAPLEGCQIFVLGQIRAGRTEEAKDQLIQNILDTVAEDCSRRRDEMWCYITEIPPVQMAEFGRVLPRSGEEPAWSAELPTAVRKRLEAIGREAA